MMSKEKHPLDKAAEQMEDNANSISKGRTGTESFAELSYCLEVDVIGEYPQANPVDNKAFIDDGYLYLDRFPEPASDPIEYQLVKGAYWTDVLSASLRYLCYVVNSKALEVFKKFDLGNVRYYNAVVTDNKNIKQDYTCIFLCNHISVDDIDFSRSECFLVDMISQPIGKISITDKEDFLKKSDEANEGTLPDSEEFSHIAIGKVQLLPGKTPSASIFGMGQYLGSKVYVSTPLRDALIDAGITGLKFKENSRLFI